MIVSLEMLVDCSQECHHAFRIGCFNRHEIFDIKETANFSFPAKARRERE